MTHHDHDDHDDLDADTKDEGSVFSGLPSISPELFGTGKALSGLLSSTSEAPNRLDAFDRALQVACCRAGTEPITQSVTDLLSDAQAIWDWYNGSGQDQPAQTT